MPTYVYRCTECGEEWTELRRMEEREEPIYCPQCETKCKRTQHSSNWAFKKRWIPTKDGWHRGDM